MRFIGMRYFVVAAVALVGACRGTSQPSDAADVAASGWHARSEPIVEAGAAPVVAPSQADSASSEIQADAGAPVFDLTKECAGAPCAAYADALRTMQSRARARRDSGACFSASWGTCGKLRYLDEIEGGLQGVVRYYDDQGRLVAAAHYNVEHGGMVWNGPPQTCARKSAGDACASQR